MIIPRVVLRSSFSGSFASVRNWAICPSATTVWTSGSLLRQPPGHRYRRSADATRRGDRDSRSRLSRTQHHRRVTTDLAAPELRLLSMSCCQREIRPFGEPSSPPGTSGAVGPSLARLIPRPSFCTAFRGQTAPETASDPRPGPESRRVPKPSIAGPAAARVARTSRLQGRCLQRRSIESVATTSVNAPPSASLIACRALWFYAPSSPSPFAKALVRATASSILTALRSPLPGDGFFWFLGILITIFFLFRPLFRRKPTPQELIGQCYKWRFAAFGPCPVCRGNITVLNGAAQGECQPVPCTLALRCASPDRISGLRKCQ